jgi:hypothetical protein
VEHWTCPTQRGWGKEINSQHRNPSKQSQQQATSKAGQVVDCRADLLNQRAAFKTELPHLTEGGAHQIAAAEGQHSYQLGKSVALTTLHDLMIILHLTISIKLENRRIKHYSQTNHQVRPHQSFCLYANTRTGCQRSNSRT